MSKRLFQSSLGMVLVVLGLGLVGAGAAPRILVISPSEAQEATSIQEAIDTAEPGSVVVLRPGTYRGNLIIAKPLKLIGLEGVFVEPIDVSQPVIAIRETEAVSIQGLRIRMAGIGVEISRASCSISDCSISASIVGMQILGFEGDAVEVRACELKGADGGLGIGMGGSGDVFLANCTMGQLGSGVLITGGVRVIAVGCSIAHCFDGMVIVNTASTVLLQNRISENARTGVRLDRSFVEGAVDGYLEMSGNQIEENARWGLSFCGPDGSNPLPSGGYLTGNGNRFAGNGQGSVCSADLSLPDGFIRP